MGMTPEEKIQKWIMRERFHREVSIWCDDSGLFRARAQAVGKINESGWYCTIAAALASLAERLVVDE